MDNKSFQTPTRKPTFYYCCYRIRNFRFKSVSINSFPTRRHCWMKARRLWGLCNELYNIFVHSTLIRKGLKTWTERFFGENGHCAYANILLLLYLILSFYSYCLERKRPFNKVFKYSRKSIISIIEFLQLYSNHYSKDKKRKIRIVNPQEILPYGQNGHLCERPSNCNLLLERTTRPVFLLFC